MNGPRQSDRSVVPKKAANKGGAAALLAESLEERDLPKGNPHEQTNRRAQDRKRLQQAQARIRRMAQYVRTFIPKGRARCGNPACRELCGGSPVTGIPTATKPSATIPASRDDLRGYQHAVARRAAGRPLIRSNLRSLATKCGRGRNPRHRGPPAQFPAGGITAPGSSLGYERANVLGHSPYPRLRLLQPFPVLCPAVGLLVRIPLGQVPFLQRLRQQCRSTPFVRRLLRYYGPVRLPGTVHHRITPWIRGADNAALRCRSSALPIPAQ